MTELLAGRYELGAVLRSSALSIVRRGRDLQLDRDVAVTLLRDELVRDEASVGLFAATVAVGAELAHPGLVGVYDAGVTEYDGASVRWAVGELVDAPNLDQYSVPDGLAERWPDTVLVLAEQLADAMQHAHGDGAVHGNLGPATVLLETGAAGAPGQGDVGEIPRVRVTGFGPQAADLAVLSDPELTVRMWQAFTEQLEYPSPEQRAGMAPTRRSDVYGFGCVLAALLLIGENARASAMPGATGAPGDDTATDARASIGADAGGGMHPSPLGEPGDPHERALQKGLSHDTAHELGLIGEQAMSLKPADRQHSFAVVRDQLKWIRVARSLEQRDAAAADGVPTDTIAGLAPRAAATPEQGGQNAPTMVLPPLAYLGTTASEAPPQTEQLRYLLTRPLPPERPRARDGLVRRKRSKGGIMFAALVGVIVLVVGFGWFVNQSNSQAADAEVTIPAVSGHSVEEATSVLGKAGIALGGQVVRADPAVALGLVVATDPAAGTQVQHSRAVTLVVSGGPDLSAVPQLKGLSLSAAQDALKAAGLVAGEVEQRDGLNSPGMVLDSTPSFGTSVGAGSTVVIVVASGNQRVPGDLVGQAGGAAQQALASAGLAPQVVKRPSSDATPGTVIDVSPGSGSSVPLGSIVTLTIAEYSPAPPGQPSNVPDAPAVPGDGVADPYHPDGPPKGQQLPTDDPTEPSTDTSSPTDPPPAESGGDDG